METLLDHASKDDYDNLVSLEKRYISMNFINFFYKKLETEYTTIHRNGYGRIAEFRILSTRIHSNLSTASLCQQLIHRLECFLEKLQDSTVFPLLFSEFRTLQSIIDCDVALKELDYKNSALNIYGCRIYYKKWISYYTEIHQIHQSVRKILDLQLEKFNFIFSITNTSDLNIKFDRIIKNPSQKLLVLGITDNGLKRYTCMPSINSKTGLARFPLLYSKNSECNETVLPGIISILYYWRRLGCSLKRLNYKNLPTRDVKNDYIPWGVIISFTDSDQVYEMLLLDSRIFVVLISGKREYSSLANEQILSNALKIWSS